MRIRFRPALVCLATVVALTGCSSSADSSSPTATAKDSAKLACRIFAELPAKGFDFPKDEVSIGRLSAVQSLAGLAQAQDAATYKDLVGNAYKLTSVVQKAFTASGADWDLAYANLKASCDKVQ